MTFIYSKHPKVSKYYSGPLHPSQSQAWEWGSTEAGSASSVSDSADVIKGWKSVCFGSAGQLGVGRVEEQPPVGQSPVGQSRYTDTEVSLSGLGKGRES